MSTDAYIGIGSNLQNPKQQVLNAMLELKQIKGTRLTAQSSLYLSPPFDSTDQPDYVNAVVKLETDITAESLLLELQLLENRHGRIRTDERWQARTLDLDILVYGIHEIQQSSLVVPHPELKRRNFVLYPLQEISPDLSIPGLGLVSVLVANCSQGNLQKLSITNGFN